MRCEIFQNVFANFPGRGEEGGRRRLLWKYSKSQLWRRQTQGRATKEKHDGATATDMEKDGLFLKRWKGLKLTPATKQKH